MGICDKLLSLFNCKQNYSNNNEISIISNNCLAGMIYKDLGMRF